MTTLLRYDLKADQFPLQASPQTGDQNIIQLTVAASNPDPSTPVTLEGLIITIPVGKDDTDLTADATDIHPVPLDGWKLDTPVFSADSVRYVYHPQPGHGVVKGDGLNFIFNNVVVNQQTGTVEVYVMEGSNNCTPDVDCPEAQVAVTKWPHGWGQVSLTTSPDPPIVKYDDGPTLYWSGPEGATYQLEYYTPQTGIVHIPAVGNQPLGSNGQYPGSLDPAIHLTQDTTFYLNVDETIDKLSYSARQQVTATVELPVPTIKLFTGKIQWSKNSMSLILNWDTQNAITCRMTGDEHPVFNSSLDDSYVITASVEKPLLYNNYTLTAENEAGTTTSEINLEWGVLLATPGGTKSCVACSHDGSRVYITDPNTLHVLDPTTLQPLKSVSLLFYPNGIACSPDGAYLYLTDNDNSVYKFDAITLQQVGPAAGIGNIPLEVVASPDGSRLYVGGSPNGDIVIVVSVLNTATLQPIGQPVQTGLFGGSFKSGLAISPDNSRVYVASNDINSNSFTIQAFETTSDPGQPLKAAEQYTGTDYVMDLAVTLDSTHILAAFSGGSNNITVFDVATLQPVGQLIQLPSQPYGIALSPDNARVFVMDWSGTISGLAPSAVTGGTPG
jgi:DNA-binding beta-propeller fold protein YncE